MPDPANPLVALVDDEENIRETVGFALRREGYRVETFVDGQQAWESFESALPDLVILDIIMPRMDGLELCRNIRGVSKSIPLFFLTSRDEEFDRVLGLELGADDYLCKPFSMRELTVRIKVLFRRAALQAQQPEENDTIECGSLHLDVQRFTLHWKNTHVPLTVTEFRILQALIAHPGHVKTRQNLMEKAFPHDGFMSDRTVDCHIKRLRKKISAVDPGFAGIETIYGLGYRFIPD